VRIFGQVLYKGDVKWQRGRSRVNARIALCVNISETVRNTSEVTTNDYGNRKLHMRFRLAPRVMTLDDLELLYVWIFLEFCVISQIWEGTTAKRMKIDLCCQRCIHYVDILLGFPLLARGVYNHNTVGWKWRFSVSRPENISQFANRK